MNRNWLTSARNIGDSAVDIFMLPGESLVAAAGSIFDAIPEDSALPASILLSTICWLLLVAVAVKVWRLACRAAASTRLAVVTSIVRAKTKLAGGKPRRPPVLQSQETDAGAEIHFDNLDLAVLDSAATLGPGFALTAPDLAKEFNLRPPQVQSSLEKLTTNMMLVRGFGTDDGHQSYRLSRAGAVFLSMWKRKQA